MKNSLFIFILVVFIALGAYLYYVKNSANKNQALETYNTSAAVTSNQWEPTKVPPQIIEVTANGGTFNPTDFNLTQHQDTILKVNAVDQDYSFTIKEFDLQASAPRGQVTEITVPGKAVGTFTYTCGPNCEGRVNIQDNDEDAEFN